MVDREDWFIETFKPQQNHLDDNASFFDLAKKSNRVWTIIEGDDDTLFYASGFHYVNRLGFIVTEKEYDGVIDIQVE
jgi:hypothetical protein